MKVVMDASALLAWLHDEKGAEKVEKLLPQAVMSTVNWAEVIQHTLAHGVSVQGLREEVQALGIELIPFDATMAETVGKLQAQTRRAGLSLGDRACLALAQLRKYPAVTADRAWEKCALDIKVQLIR